MIQHVDQNFFIRRYKNYTLEQLSDIFVYQVIEISPFINEKKTLFKFF